MQKSILAVAVLLAISPAASKAQVCGGDYFRSEASLIVSRLQKISQTPSTGGAPFLPADVRKAFNDFLNSPQTALCVSPDANKGLAEFLPARTVQTGASVAASGTTTVASSGTVPNLLGLAVEYGAVSQSFSGTTVTFGTTPAKVVAALANAYGPDAPAINDAAVRALQRLSFSASFDTSRTSSADTKSGGTLLANYQQLSQASARFLLINDRDPFAAGNWKRIKNAARDAPPLLFANAGNSLANALDDNVRTKAIDSAMARYDALIAKSAVPNTVDIQSILTDFATTIKQVIEGIPSTLFQRYSSALADAADAHDGIYQRILRAPTLSLEFDLNRPPAVSPLASVVAPVTSPGLAGANLIFTGSLLATDYTLNASANFFTQTRPGMSGNFRDFQIAGKWDIPVGGWSRSSKGTLTFSGLYENLHQKPLGIGLQISDQDVNQPGDIGLFQVRYSIPIGDSGVNIPFSFTASNRSELIHEKELRGNIGLTFDLDKLFLKK